MDYKQRAKEEALNLIKLRYGGSAAIPLSKLLNKSHCVIPTGIEAIDEITGLGGIPCGRIVEIYGTEGTGKTYLALSISARVSKNEGVLYIDSDNGLSSYMLEASGINKQNFCISYADTLEKAFAIAEIAAENFKLIVIDSLPSLSTDIESISKIGQDTYSARGKIIEHCLNRLLHKLSLYSCTLVIVNQVREKIGVMFGDPLICTGGKALQSYKSMGIRLSMNGLISSRTGANKIRIRTKITKNKCGTPNREAVFEICI